MVRLTLLVHFIALVGFCQAALIQPPPQTLPPPLPPPVCNYNGTEYQAGTDFNPDACTSCTCPDGGGDPLCAMMACLVPNCVDSITEDGKCCATCPNGPNCKYNGKIVPVGDFKPSPCEFCHCPESGGESYCAIMDCAMPQCVDAVRQADQCCPTCPNGPNCEYNGKVYPAGDFSPSPCEWCHCSAEGMLVSCYMSACAMPNCVDSVTEPGQCCPSCPNGPNCKHNGRIVPVGDFNPSPCEFCHCQADGIQVYCAIMDCALPLCVDAVTEPGQCCPSCPNGNNCYAGSKIIPTGIDVTVDGMICRCEEGYDPNVQADCRPIPTTPPPMCKYNGTVYPPGEFHPSPCEWCSCPQEGGLAICAEVDCAVPQCVDARTEADECCPTCPNGPNCYYGEEIVPAGSYFRRNTKICRCPEPKVDQDPATVNAVCKRNRKKLNEALSSLR